ncbi:WD repeat-containing protein 33, partial [Coemansia nantahalensis]
LQRTTIDHFGATLRGLELRHSGARPSLKGLAADPSYTVDMFPSVFVPEEAETSITTRFVQQALNKQRNPVNVIRWTPEGRRLITGSSRGELTLWNGLSFNFETIMTAHDTPIHSMEWSHDGQWMVSGGHDGIVKYWQSSLNNLQIIQAHKAPVRGLSFCPTDAKFVTASDDQTLKIWDFRQCREERALSGHTWEVRTVDWHPFLGMVASGGKDNMVRAWDPRTARCLATVGRHNNSVTQLQWNRNGRWLLSGGRDNCIKLFDVRKLKEELATFSTPREINSIAWHPVHEALFASGGSLSDPKDMMGEGTIQFWMADEAKQKACIEGAHGSQIWSLAWHPLGHVLASGSNDKATRFWCRPRPAEHLPTELGGGDVDERIFRSPINAQAADSMASRRERASRESTDSAQRPTTGATGGALPGLPGLQAPDVGRMLARIREAG